MLPLVDDLDVTTARVQAPTAVIFLCGGQCTDLSEAVPASLRDAFLKILDFPPLRNRELVQAEDFTVQSLFGDFYANFLAFETDLAELTEVILLFAESEGSLAELGSFVMVDEIAQRLLVVIRDKYWNENSFIKLGPLKYLEQKYGQESIFVIDDNDVGLIKNVSMPFNKDILSDLLIEPVYTFIKRSRVPTTLDINRPGHAVKLAVGLVQEYGALTADEIRHVLSMYGINDGILNRIPSLLLCAKSVAWIDEKRKGSKTFYVPINDNQAATFYIRDGAEKNRTRRRMEIRQYWEENDKLRHMVIKANTGSAAL